MFQKCAKRRIWQRKRHGRRYMEKRRQRGNGACSPTGNVHGLLNSDGVTFSQSPHRSAPGGTPSTPAQSSVTPSSLRRKRMPACTSRHGTVALRSRRSSPTFKQAKQRQVAAPPCLQKVATQPFSPEGNDAAMPHSSWQGRTVVQKAKREENRAARILRRRQ